MLTHANTLTLTHANTLMLTHANTLTLTHANTHTLTHAKHTGIKTRKHTSINARKHTSTSMLMSTQYLRACCKTIFTTLFYIRSYKCFAPNYRYTLSFSKQFLGEKVKKPTKMAFFTCYRIICEFINILNVSLWLVFLFRQCFFFQSLVYFSLSPAVGCFVSFLQSQKRLNSVKEVKQG